MRSRFVLRASERNFHLQAPAQCASRGRRGGAEQPADFVFQIAPVTETEFTEFQHPDANRANEELLLRKLRALSPVTPVSP